MISPKPSVQRGTRSRGANISSFPGGTAGPVTPLTVSLWCPSISECVLTAVGEIDVESVDLFASGLQAGCSSPATCLLSVDLTGVAFFSAAGLHPLLAAHERLRERGARLALLPSEVVQLVVHAAGVADGFPSVSAVRSRISE